MHKNAIKIVWGVKFVALFPKFMVLFEEKNCGAFFGAFWPNCGASWFKIIRHTAEPSSATSYILQWVFRGFCKIVSIKIEKTFIMSFQEMKRKTSAWFNGQNELTRTDLNDNETENPNDDIDISIGSAFKSKVEGIVFKFY